jgi:hypothetical protein
MCSLNLIRSLFLEKNWNEYIALIISYLILLALKEDCEYSANYYLKLYNYIVS